MTFSAWASVTAFIKFIVALKHKQIIIEKSKQFNLAPEKVMTQLTLNKSVKGFANASRTNFISFHSGCDLI